MIETIDVAGSMTVPSVDLPAGTVFWRLRGRVGANVGNEPSPTWQVVVRARSTPLDLSWGSVLDVNGDGFADVAVGAPTALDDYGRVHVYLGAASGLATTPATSLTGPDGQGFFGWSVASASDVNGDGFADLIVGAPYYLGVPWAGTNAGRAYVYLGSETGLGTLATTVVAPDGDGSLFGSSVAFAGDINSDGYADVAVGATGTANGTGTVYVYFGGAGGISTSPAITIPGTDGPGAGFGYAVTNAGDLDGDGHGDLAVGAPSILQGAGHVHIYFGTVTGLATTPVTLAGPAGAGDHFAMSIAADDFDGDGYADLVVGEPAANGDWGQVCVYPGGTMGISASPAITYVGSYASQSGSAVDSAGDLDADGFADLIVGLPAMSPPPFDYTVGAADIYLGGSSGLASIRSAEVTVGLGIDYSEFGASVAGAGDVDGDGHGDVIVGAPVFNCCPTNSGAVFVYSGTDTGLDTNASAAWGGPDGANGAFGQSLN